MECSEFDVNGCDGMPVLVYPATILKLTVGRSMIRWKEDPQNQQEGILVLVDIDYALSMVLEIYQQRL